MPKPASQHNKLEWEEKIQRQRESGLSVRRWCLENQINRSAFDYWKMRCSEKIILKRSSFTELVDALTAGIIVEYRGARFHIDKHFDSLTLKRALVVMAEIRC
jgi:hypothetical protein